MDKIQKIIFWILVCVLLIGVGGEVLYHSNSGFQNFVNQLFHIQKSNEIDYENDEYVKSLKTEIETLKGEIEKYKQEDKILNARIQELENRVTILEQKVAVLEKQKEELNAQIDALVLEVEEVWELLFDYVENQDESEIDAIIQDKVIGLENDLEDLQKEYEETKKDNTDRIKDINDELKNLNEEKKNTGDLIINIQRDIEDNRTIINNLYEINKEYYVTYYNLIIKIEKNTATDEEKSQYEQIKSQIDENDSKIQEKEAENAVFSERMQNYMTQLDAIEKRIVVLEEEVSMLENEMQEIENKINDTINELNKFRNYLDKNPNVHEHIPGEEIIENLIKATCTTEGSYSICVYCTVDGELISQTNVIVKPSGHKKGKTEVVERIEPTCYVEGYILQETYCLNCKEILSSSKIVLEPSHTMGEKVIENKTETTYDEVIYCTVCKYEFERRTITKEDKPANENDIYYNSNALNKITISNYNNMSEDKQEMSKYVSDNLNGYFMTDNYYYIYNGGASYITGFWIYDRNTNTLHLGDDYFGYDDYTIFNCEESSFPNYVIFASLNGSYKLHLQTNELEVLEKQYNKPATLYNGTYIYQYNYLRDNVRVEAENVINKLESLSGISFNIGTLYFNNENNDISGLWLFRDNILYPIAESVMNVETTKFNLILEDEIYYYFETESGFSVSVEKSNCRLNIEYIYNDVEIYDYENIYFRTYKETSTAKYIIDNLDETQYFENSNKEKIIYQINDNSSIGFWAYSESRNEIYLIWYSGFSAELVSCENNIYVFKTITSTFTYYADESRYERT